MAWQYIRIARFGGQVLELAEQPTIPDPGPGEVRIKVLAAGRRARLRAAHHRHTAAQGRARRRVARV